MSDIIQAWHFVGDTLRDGRPIPPDGEWLIHDGPVIPCKSGLHASERIIDALKYAPGAVVCRVDLRGDIRPHGGDKLAARERRILWRIDASEILRTFARRCALDMVHFWDAPDVVRRWLETGDEKLRSAAWSAAWSVAESAAWSAASAESAACAAWSAARSAARSAAWSAAESAAWSAASAESAASAARSAASAAESAAESAERAAQNAVLTAMIEEAKP